MAKRDLILNCGANTIPKWRPWTNTNSVSKNNCEHMNPWETRNMIEYLSISCWRLIGCTQKAQNTLLVTHGVIFIRILNTFIWCSKLGRQ